MKITIPFTCKDGLRLFIKFYIIGFEFVGFYKDIAWVLEKEETENGTNKHYLQETQ